MDPRQRRMRRQGYQGRGRGPQGQGPPGQTGVMPNEAQPMVPPGGLAGPPAGAGPTMGASSSLPAQPMGPGPGGPQPPMLKPAMDREGARNQRMNTAWQAQLAQQGGMGYGGPGAMQSFGLPPGGPVSMGGGPPGPEIGLKPMQANPQMAQQAGVQNRAIQSLMRSGGGLV